MPILVQLPEKYQPLVDAFLQTVQTVQTLQDTVPDGAPVDYQQVEQSLAQGCAALERAAHAAALQLLDVDAPQVTIHGQTYRRVMRSPGSYYTLAGEVSVPRTLYRKLGERSAATVDAISLRCGVVGDGWLPSTAQAMAWECQRAPAREAQAASEMWHRLPYSRCAFERVTHLVGQQYQNHRAAVERQLVEQLPIPDQAHSVSVSLDRVSVPMEEPRPGPQQYKAACSTRS